MQSPVLRNLANPTWSREVLTSRWQTSAENQVVEAYTSDQTQSFLTHTPGSLPSDFSLKLNRAIYTTPRPRTQFQVYLTLSSDPGYQAGDLIRFSGVKLGSFTLDRKVESLLLVLIPREAILSYSHEGWTLFPSGATLYLERVSEGLQLVERKYHRVKVYVAIYLQAPMEPQEKVQGVIIPGQVEEQYFQRYQNDYPFPYPRFN